jgi:hypothetical protein
MERIIVRTTSNISYAGSVAKEDFFQDEGLVIKINPNAETLCFIPKDEIKEVISGAVQMTYEQFQEI